MRIECVDSFYVGRADRSVDVYVVDGSRVMCAYNEGNGYVKLFPTVGDMVSYITDADETDVTYVDMTLDDYNESEEKLNEIVCELI